MAVKNQLVAIWENGRWMCETASYSLMRLYFPGKKEQPCIPYTYATAGRLITRASFFPRLHHVGRWACRTCWRDRTAYETVKETAGPCGVENRAVLTFTFRHHVHTRFTRRRRASASGEIIDDHKLSAIGRKSRQGDRLCAPSHSNVHYFRAAFHFVRENWSRCRLISSYDTRSRLIKYHLFIAFRENNN